MDIRLLRGWMYDRVAPDKISCKDEYVRGVHSFINYVRSQPRFASTDEIRCPCRKCENGKHQKYEVVVVHLCRWGFKSDYWYWTSHGEVEPPINNINAVGSSSRSGQVFHEEGNNRYRDLVHDTTRDVAPNFEVTEGQDLPNVDYQRFYELLTTSQRPLWEGCDTQTDLSLSLQMMTIKAEYNMSQSCYNQLSNLIRKLVPKDNYVPENFYKAKKLISKLGLTSIKIDCCINGCMLYYKEDADLIVCKFCNESRFKSNRSNKPVPRKIMHYLSLIPRLKRLYASHKSAPHMQWHSENRREKGVMCHPSDGKAWKNFDEAHPNFAAEPRNIRLGLCMDGFNPCNSSDPYSCWPVIVTPYNMPPEMCMTTPYMFLTCIIPGPKNPKDRIDVYLRPLIDELKLLWEPGVETWDISKKENFQLRAALMWTINDFHVYGILSGWMTCGRLACPICMENSKAFYLKYSRKITWFDCHRQFLPHNHPFRNSRDKFTSGRKETSNAPPRLDGHQELARVKHLPSIEELHPNDNIIEGYGVTHNWTKKSIFWELSYWKDNLVRHNLDVMHIEKNVFDNVFNMVMDIKGMTKDNEQARKDLESHCRRSELHLQSTCDGKVVKPKASYAFSVGEKRTILNWIENVKMPDGYASNLSRCIDKSNLKLRGMKNHNCHVFMQRLLPIAFSILPPNVWNPLTELSLFFKDLCSTELRVEKLRELEQNIPIILCKLEKIFPCAFFDSMEHLTVHLPYEALMCGPVQYRLTYHFERFLHNLKGMVKNKARVEGSICEAYLAQEAAYFASYYFESNIKTKSTRIRQNELFGGQEYTTNTLSVFKQTGRPVGKCVNKWLDRAQHKAAQYHVLMNCDEVLPMVETFKRRARRCWPDLSEEQVDLSLEKNFAEWFRNYVHHPSNNNENHSLIQLSWSPSLEVQSWQKYRVNGYTFHVNELGEDHVTYNAGVCVKGEDETEFYGVLQQIIQLQYPGSEDNTVILFSCKWYDSLSNRGIRRHPQYGIVEINVKEEISKDEPFILPQHASQVYYLPYPNKKKDKVNWRVVINTRPRSKIGQRCIMLQEPHAMSPSIVHIDTEGSLVDENGPHEEVQMPTLQTHKLEGDQFIPNDEEEDEGEETEEDEGEETEEDEDEETEEEEEEDSDEDDNVEMNE